MGRERKGRGRKEGEGGNSLLPAHPHPLFQIRPRAETIVHFARQYQHPGPLPMPHLHLSPTTTPFPFPSSFPILALHSLDLSREFREQLAGDGVAGAGVVEAEDADVARVRGGDVVGFYQGGRRGCCCWGEEEAGVVVVVKGDWGEEEEEGGGGRGEEEVVVVVVFVKGEGGTHGWEAEGGEIGLDCDSFLFYVLRLGSFDYL